MDGKSHWLPIQRLELNVFSGGVEGFRYRDNTTWAESGGFRYDVQRLEQTFVEKSFFLDRS
jgi:hypothetical protein